MAMKRKTRGAPKNVEALRHPGDTRKNIPTAEHRAVLEEEQKGAPSLRYPRNPDLDPQLVWRGKDEQDWSDLVVHAPPLYIQEKVHPKVLIDDLMRRSRDKQAEQPGAALELFADFNGLPAEVDRTEFYRHDQNWSNRMILGDSLQVMASLAEREGLRGHVQCIYLDPPYGIKFNSNFQWSTTSRDVKDGKADHITREPEQVKAFRDTWRDGIHSYLTYLRDRLTVARDLLAESGSIFVQIGDENVHRVRALMDEVFGEENFISLVSVTKTTSATSDYLSGVADFILWFGKSKAATKYRPMHRVKSAGGEGSGHYSSVLLPDGSLRTATASERGGDLPDHAILVTSSDLQSASMGRDKGEGAASWFAVECHGRVFWPTMQTRWKTNQAGMDRLGRARRLHPQHAALRYIRRIDDFAAFGISNVWTDIGGAPSRQYVVETAPRIVERCMLMATDPGDLVLDPTCGSGTTATVAEQWGRRWITIDTSRVALTLARARIMGARYPYYLLADSPEGQQKEAEVTHTVPKSAATHGNIRHGFVYERVPHITLKSIANNAEIDVIWERFEEDLAPLREELSVAIGKKWIDAHRKTQRYDVEVPDAIQEWEVPRELPGDWPKKAAALHERFWELRIARQKEIDASIAAKADHEYLYDRPYEDKRTVRVAGPLTVESLSPHRVLTVDEDDELVDPQVTEPEGAGAATPSFERMVLENLKAAGVQQAHKEDRIVFRSLTGWAGTFICAEGRYQEGDAEKRAGVFLGPEFGTVSRPDLVEAAREAGEAGFDVLIACAFNYEAHASEFHKLGRIPVLKARMNADLHMAAELKSTGQGNLFVIFGEPDIDVVDAEDGRVRVKVNGVDVFDPSTGEVRSDDADGIACWFVDTDYNGESFFVRHAYFLGANDPYKSLKTTLKAEIDAEAWGTLHSDTSRAFPKPEGGRIAVKVINHLGDEVMEVLRV